MLSSSGNKCAQNGSKNEPRAPRTSMECPHEGPRVVRLAQSHKLNVLHRRRLMHPTSTTPTCCARALSLHRPISLAGLPISPPSTLSTLLNVDRRAGNIDEAFSKCCVRAIRFHRMISLSFASFPISLSCASFPIDPPHPAQRQPPSREHRRGLQHLPKPPWQKSPFITGSQRALFHQLPSHQKVQEP